LWPECPPVFQHTASFAYLMGGLPPALVVLERAAELESDHVAVRTNLERLRRKIAQPGG
jgi:hypothetical protein